MKTQVKNYSTALCSDKLFGTIFFDGMNWEWGKIHSERYSTLNCKEPIKNSEEFSAKSVIIIVLESPHIKEFDSSGQPICPANGQSGQSICDSFCKILNSSPAKFKNNSKNLSNFLSGKNDLDVWIVNSIQRQCSLGITPIQHLVKESNWIDEWFSSNNDFLKRIKKIIQDKDWFVVNLCTKGIYVPLKKLVKEEVMKLQGITHCYCEGLHPSSWKRMNKVELRD